MGNFFSAPYWSYVRDFADIVVVAAIIYGLMMLARGTRAWRIMWGLLVFGLIFAIASALRLRTLVWVLRQVIPLAPVALVILFYPELRYALEELGRVRFWQSRLRLLPRENIERMVGRVVRVCAELSRQRIGALIVFEREEGLQDLIQTGTPMDATVTAAVISTIFHPGTTLHDGALMISGDRIVAAACVLPLTDRPGLGPGIHTRHRAALGVSERSDAVAVVVSEETGTVSVSIEGRLERGLSEDGLRTCLMEALAPTTTKPPSLWSRWRTPAP